MSLTTNDMHTISYYPTEAKIENGTETSQQQILLLNHVHDWFQT